MAPSRLMPNAACESSACGEPLGERDVGQVDRDERQQRGRHQPRPERQRQQPLGLDHVGERQRHGDPGEHHRERRRAEPPRRLHGRQHDQQHPGEHHRVDDPGGAEEQFANVAMFLVSSSRNAAPMKNRSAYGRIVAERAAEDPHQQQRDQQDAAQRPQVDRRAACRRRSTGTARCRSPARRGDAGRAWLSAPHFWLSGSFAADHHRGRPAKVSMHGSWPNAAAAVPPSRSISQSSR